MPKLWLWLSASTLKETYDEKKNVYINSQNFIMCLIDVFFHFQLAYRFGSGLVIILILCILG